MQIGGTPIQAIRHPHSPPRLVAEYLPLAPLQKQVCFDLANDLGNASSLPTDLANLLGEDVSNEQIDVPCLPCSLDHGSSTATP